MVNICRYNFIYHFFTRRMCVNMSYCLFTGEKGLIELFRDGCSRFKNRKQSQPIPTSDP